MMKVKIFKKYAPNWLEDSLNEWLEKNNNIQIIDIKFDSHLSERHREKIDCYTAMIIYKEKLTTVFN